MQVTKWEMTDYFRSNGKTEEDLLKEGWEPFATADRTLLFRRPVGYIEVEERIVQEKGEVKPEQVITKEVSINLDSIKKIEPEQQTSVEIQKKLDNREFDVEL